MRRNWEEANAKRGPCRVCGRTDGVELAHVTERANDAFYPYDTDLGQRPRTKRPATGTIPVSRHRVVPLCGPATDPNSCHGKYDEHKLDLTPYLTAEEAAQAVLDSGSLEAARIRVSGQREQRKEAAA